MEGALQHWFGSLTVVYDGDPAAPSAGSPAASESKEQPATTAAGQVARQAQQRTQQADVLQELLPTGGSEAKAVNDDDEQKASAPQRYMFGFQPHGLYPTGEAYGLLVGMF